MNWIKQYNKERDKAVKSLNVAEFRKFYKKWQERGFYQVSLPDNDTVVEVTMRKMLFHINSATEQEKADAEKWLIDHGFTTDLR